MSDSLINDEIVEFGNIQWPAKIFNKLFAITMRKNPFSAGRLYSTCKAISQHVQKHSRDIIYSAFTVKIREEEPEPFSMMKEIWSDWAFRLCGTIEPTSSDIRKDKFIMPLQTYTQYVSPAEEGFEVAVACISLDSYMAPVDLIAPCTIYRPSPKFGPFPYKASTVHYFEVELGSTPNQGGGNYPVFGYAWPGLTGFSVDGAHGAIVITMESAMECVHCTVRPAALARVEGWGVPKPGDIIGLGLQYLPPHRIQNVLEAYHFGIAEQKHGYGTIGFITKNGKLLSWFVTMCAGFEMYPFIAGSGNTGVHIYNFSGSDCTPYRYDVRKHIDDWPEGPEIWYSETESAPTCFSVLSSLGSDSIIPKKDRRPKDSSKEQKKNQKKEKSAGDSEGKEEDSGSGNDKESNGDIDNKADVKEEKDAESVSKEEQNEKANQNSASPSDAAEPKDSDSSKDMDSLKVKIEEEEPIKSGEDGASEKREEGDNSTDKSDSSNHPAEAIQEKSSQSEQSLGLNDFGNESKTDMETVELYIPKSVKCPTPIHVHHWAHRPYRPLLSLQYGTPVYLDIVNSLAPNWAILSVLAVFGVPLSYTIPTIAIEFNLNYNEMLKIFEAQTELLAEGFKRVWESSGKTEEEVPTVAFTLFIEYIIISLCNDFARCMYAGCKNFSVEEYPPPFLSNQIRFYTLNQRFHTEDADWQELFENHTYFPYNFPEIVMEQYVQWEDDRRLIGCGIPIPSVVFDIATNIIDAYESIYIMLSVGEINFHIDLDKIFSISKKIASKCKHYPEFSKVIGLAAIRTFIALPYFATNIDEKFHPNKVNVLEESYVGLAIMRIYFKEHLEEFKPKLLEYPIINDAIQQFQRGNATADQEQLLMVTQWFIGTIHDFDKRGLDFPNPYSSFWAYIKTFFWK